MHYLSKQVFKLTYYAGGLKKDSLQINAINFSHSQILKSEVLFIFCLNFFYLKVLVLWSFKKTSRYWKHKFKHYNGKTFIKMKVATFKYLLQNVCFNFLNKKFHARLIYLNCSKTSNLLICSKLKPLSFQLN